MNVREWFVLGAVAVVLVGASGAAIYGAANMSSNALAGSQPHLRSLYNPQGAEHEAVVQNITGCLVHYSKVDPSLWGQDNFDTTPLSVMSEQKRHEDAQQIRTRLETPCLAFGMLSATQGKVSSTEGVLTVHQYQIAAQQLGMDVPAAQQWYKLRFSR